MGSTIRTRADKAADICIIILLSLCALAALFPLYYVVIMSMTPITEVLRSGGFVLLPREVTFVAYRELFASPRIPNALLVSVTVTVVGTALSLAVSALLAYPLSKAFVLGRNFFLMAIVFTMLFNGGLIPTYLVIYHLQLYNTLWALILPGMLSTFNLLVMKTYFENLPAELEEAARVDGCGEIRTLLQIVLPLSLPILATLGLFYGVAFWNDYFKGLMYISDTRLQPVQFVLRNMIQTPSVSQELGTLDPTALSQLPPETLKMAAVVVTTLPIFMVYPFLQKYFVKGMLIGAVKG
ncbi:carbohydrate ABC transporter permease [Paenibacillus sp. PAMC21692]|uniref:carbohydrate ABC transporter permease n=1 Tax=Paenibacillus sp. PAMC21692 TaxID=2762320 RepID=UPI00164DA3B9|nr:carbohydrate ABC transporter permease [Paenibacillus sp. PAMC21692]QNK57226.1 carbohydrate ABC transporter permease [Paenibacillus sp. PAMC21692]